MPILLMVFLVMVCLPEPEAWSQLPRWTDSPWNCVAVTWLAVLLIATHAFWVARRVSGPLESQPALRERLLARYERGRAHNQIAVFVIYITVLLLGGWGWAVTQVWRGNTSVWPGMELVILSPFVTAQLLAWAAYYEAERASHRSAHRKLATEPNAGAWLELERSRSAAPPSFGSRASYVIFQLRQKLALVFLPVLLLLVQKEVQRLFPIAWQDWQKTVNLLGIASVLLVVVALPWIVRLILGLKPLPLCPLRRRLEALGRRLRFRCSNILVWDTRNGMANAFVIGIVPLARYVVFTDRLLEDFTPDEIEAVFGHEVGHVRHYHMLYYFSFLSSSVLVLNWLILEVIDSCRGLIPLALGNLSSESLSILSLVPVLLAYIFVVFGFLSRRCERQADVFGCRAVSCSSLTCLGHEENDLRQSGQGLCPTGIRTFIRALEKVALVNGISRDQPGFLHSWQHASIGRRIEFLRGILFDPGVERRFQHRLFLFKSLLLLVLGGAIALILIQEANAPPPVTTIRAATVRER
ncbi:MAG: M48 family metallopeptidase [Gemmataceae bacterium]